MRWRFLRLLCLQALIANASAFVRLQEGILARNTEYLRKDVGSKSTRVAFLAFVDSILDVRRDHLSSCVCLSGCSAECTRSFAVHLKPVLVRPGVLAEP